MASSRSASPEPRSKYRKSSEHKSRSYPLPRGVEPIDEDHYFLKSSEFARWLREEKGKYFDELKSDKARSYFRKFVRAWNKGKLSDDLYHSTHSISASSNQITSYKWSFTDNNSALENERRKKVREAIGDDTYGPTPVAPSDTQKSRRVLGPSLPTTSDLQLSREEANDLAAAERLAKRKREKLEDRERLEDMVGPKEVGKERLLEVKRVKREGDRAYRESKEDGGLEVSEDILMGSGSSFKQRLAQRDAARARFEAKMREEREARTQERSERVEQIRERDKKTMDMFRQLAKERFG